MDKKIILVEDFYSQPDQIRSLALDEQYASVAKLNYPGYQSHKVFSSDSLRISFEKLVGNQIVVDTDRFTFGGFRLITEETGSLPKVHADTIDWAAMVFLTPDAPADKGLGFYRHKETGLEGPPSDHKARELGFEDATEFEREVIHRDQADLSCWELVSSVSPVYNRLVMFKGRELYHAPISGFGDSPENCRITHNFFFLESK
ncbi:DUF6445 family protein [Halobacillus sp. A1]|uniref:DUF6445 family protein n=1 Tax=Halobacillus sp. A1 TaxID=2880262 RepID=UPI0020A65E64|nr:DUF6445 family protein [Halobacillus sp. A1]MCP3033466.1 DUF6445 family protein [Halobacillus sp. A1]